ncbi:MAG TPA: NAD(P)/FAD-dependent oxidoreductase [Ohtaekwangia sp.]|uniref:FAD-dependent oxidoreductase n=1 Tax=Ohtaekwangia sp. TaxID=2066019 RepID=UPI002F931BB3
MAQSRHIAIVGAGLVGSLLAIYLRKRGYRISLFERRPDMRKNTLLTGRSINLALSNRGIRALEEVGLADAIQPVAIPMHGRTIHNLQGNLTFQPYGKEGQYINSVSRSNLNIVLMNKAEAEGASLHFNQRVIQVDTDRTTLTVASPENHLEMHIFDYIIGADGAFSAIRQALQSFDRFDFSQEYIAHGYKELHIPAGPRGGFPLEKNTLHIWPRQSYMMIALPNPDGSFTCTLFLPFEGDVSFASLTSDLAIKNFFATNFPDATKLMPSLLQDFNQNPTSSLVTMKCFPWVRNKTLLIGDAAHAIVPFYGQGMNAGFEDCRILNALLNRHHDDWEKVLQEFQQERKSDTDAIAQLALDNFVEMRDLVTDADFLLRKKIEAKLHAAYPDRWIPLYSMVTFNDSIRYSEAYSISRTQKKIMDEVMSRPGIENSWESLDLSSIIQRLPG